jgi:hypothetical protein
MYYSLLGMLSIVLTTEKKQNVGGITARQGDRSKEAGFYRVGNAVLEKKNLNLLNPILFLIFIDLIKKSAPNDNIPI